MTWQVGDVIVNQRTGRRRKVVRITPAGVWGTRSSDGPVFHASTMDERDQAEPRGHVADIWSRSISYPTSEWALETDQSAVNTADPSRNPEVNR